MGAGARPDTTDDHDVVRESRHAQASDERARGGEDATPENEPAWRRRIRANPVTNQAYRAVVGLVGLVVVVVGLVLVPLAGPGWLIVIGGVAIWASEFDWAHRLKLWGLARLREWTDWVGRQPLWVRLLIGLATCAFVVAVMIVVVWFTGIPAWVPDVVEEPAVDLVQRWLPAR